MAKKTEIIRVHNQGKREYLIPPRGKKEKSRIIEPGRSIELEAPMAEKMMAAYPKDLINFESLVSGNTRNINKENKKLAADLEKAQKDNETAKKGLEVMAEREKALETEKSELEKKITDLEKALEEATKPQGE